MLTKTKIQTIKSYTDKKERNKKGLFLVEGEKSVAELLKSDLIINELFVTRDFLTKYSKDIKDCEKRHAALEKWIKPQLVEVGELNKISSLESLKNPNSAIAIVYQLPIINIENLELINKIKDKKILILDDIRDPGNMGTIIRLADWYGIEYIIASIGSVDIYNPKTISSSMGSFSRVNVIYKDIKDFILELNKKKINLIGATLSGKNANNFNWPDNGVLIIGNEANGINQELLRNIKNQITLPSYGKAESLNASIACAILLDRWFK